MTQVTLVSADNGSIKGLVVSALSEKERDLKLAIRQTEMKLLALEEKYAFSTQEFLAKFARNEIQHSDDFDEWFGESRMLAHLQGKLAKLQGIQIAE